MSSSVMFYNKSAGECTTCDAQRWTQTKVIKHFSSTKHTWRAVETRKSRKTTVTEAAASTWSDQKFHRCHFVFNGLTMNPLHSLCFFGCIFPLKMKRLEPQVKYLNHHNCTPIFQKPLKFRLSDKKSQGIPRGTDPTLTSYSIFLHWLPTQLNPSLFHPLIPSQDLLLWSYLPWCLWRLPCQSSP